MIVVGHITINYALLLLAALYLSVCLLKLYYYLEMFSRASRLLLLLLTKSGCTHTRTVLIASPPNASAAD